MDENQMELADEMAERQRAASIAAIRKGLEEQTHPDFDGENCVACGEEMPLVRLQMKRIRCTLCEEALVKRNKMFGNYRG